MKFFENFDDFSKKGSLSPEEIKRMASQDFKDPYKKGSTVFQQGFFNGSDNADLNMAIGDKDYGKQDTDGRLHMLERELKKGVPFLRDSEVKYTQDHPARWTFNMSFEKSALSAVQNENGLTFDVDFNLYIRLYYKNDKLMGAKKNTFDILLCTSVTTSEEAISQANKPDENGHSQFMKMLSKMTNSTEEEADDMVDTLSKFLYGSPDKQDDRFASDNELKAKGISYDEVLHLVPEIQSRINKFVGYMWVKYGINIV
jgi:hypothetical protein